jgi:hypothetical protein
MLVCLKDWFDTEVIDHVHSNLYDIFKYGTSILFFMTMTTLIFLYISLILFEIY